MPHETFVSIGIGMMCAALVLMVVPDVKHWYKKRKQWRELTKLLREKERSM